MVFFREIKDDDAQQLLHWRLSPRVASMMLSTVPDNLEHQLDWIRTSRKRPDYYHWIFQNDGIDAGFVSIWTIPANIPTMNIGFYIGIEKYGFMAFPALQLVYNYIFCFLHRQKIDLQIAEGNKIIKIQELCGFKRNTANDHQLKKDDTTVNFLGYSMTKEDFLNKYPPKLLLEFPTSMRQDKNFWAN